MIEADAQLEWNDRLLGDIAAAIGRGVLAAAVAVRDEARALCPVDTGALVSSLTVSELSEDMGTAEAAVFTDVGYAGYVEFGTGIRGAASPGAGPYPYNPNWPGMVAQPYLRPALDTAMQASIAAIERAVAGVL